MEVAFYNFLENCRKQAVDPVAYLQEVAKRALLFGENSVLHGTCSANPVV